MINQIKIRKKPSVIVVTKFHNDENYYHYHLTDLQICNKRYDIGCWHIKYKN